MTDKVEDCAECGGTCKIVTEPGRMMRYRKGEYEIPADFPVRTCTCCGNEWLSTQEAIDLGVILERDRLRRLGADSVRNLTERVDAHIESTPTPKLYQDPGVEELLNEIRGRGWVVAVHNDYHQDGKFHTFWLFTKGYWTVKGEGTSDRKALDEALDEAKKVERGEVMNP